MGHGFIPSQPEGLLWFGSNAQTLLRAEIGDHALSGRKNALDQSLSKSLLMLEIPIFTHRPHNSSLALGAATVSTHLSTAALPWSDWVHWTGWICHTSKQVLQPNLCHWNLPSVVIAFLKEISGVALMNSKPLASDTHLESNLTSMYKTRSVPCVHFRAAQTDWIKGMEFNVVENFNHILQDIIKFRWYFLARQHFSIDDTIHRLTFRSDFFDSKNDTRKPSSHVSMRIPTQND